MSLDSKRSAKDIFLQAIEIDSHTERAAFLEDACSDDSGLRSRVDALILAHERPESLLNKAAPEMSSHGLTLTANAPETETPGTQIGPYKLLQQIGEGGMGVVYMAEQTAPLERRVALKIIKPGMDTKQVIARFEAERQALAMMDHPNISRVLDAGTTDAGRPYFVMELVNGIPITQFCDEQHLTARERLELFIPICQAVQHAHQKGVIHRDLKPSNILVALYDSRPVPKVIDFGVAKAVNQRLTEKTMFTELGQIVGTFEYMSPEQAQRNQLDIDTRSDVYSLGVVLYELLTGDTPFERQRFRSAALDELLRIIREEDPPRPSTRLSGSRELPSVAAKRKTEPAKLSAFVQGELDWIVMKSLEKDRGRRYKTADALAEDIGRFIAGEEVSAVPPSFAYRLRKAVSKHKRFVAVASLVLVSLATGLGMALWEGHKKQVVLESLQYRIIEKGMSVALGGEPGLDRIILEAKEAGVDEDWITTIFAAREMRDEDYGAAIRRLKEAKSNNVCARALLAVAYAEHAYWSKFEEMSVGLSSAKPRPEYAEIDQAFLFFAKSYISEDRAETTRRYKDILTQFPSWQIARGLLLEHLNGSAMELGDEKLLAESEQLTAAHALLTGRTTTTRYEELNAILCRMEMEQDETATISGDLRERGESVAETLPDGNQQCFLKAVFYDFIDKKKQAAQNWQIAARTDAPTNACFAAGYFFRERRSDEVRRILDRFAPDNQEIKVARAMMYLDDPQRHEDAIAISEDVLSSTQSWWLRQSAMKVLLLLGRKDKAVLHAKRICAESDETDAPHRWLQLDKKSIEYLAGEASDATYLDANSGGLEEFYSCYTVAAQRVSEGQPQEAIELLRNGIRHANFNCVEIDWAKAFLNRLEENPNWPHSSDTRD